MKVLLTPALFLLLATPLFAQPAAVQQAAKACSLSGNLTKYGSGEPIRNAEVSISRTDTPQTLRIGGDSSTEAQQVTVVTDAGGRFRFPSLAPGNYTLVVHKNGFHGFRGMNSRNWQEFLTLTLSPGQAVTDLALAMQPGAVLSGRVQDEDGEAMAYVQVSALKWVYANHHRQLRPIGMGTTDDQGSYRIFGLEPGRYVVRANAVAEGGVAKARYAPSYYPEAASPNEASAVALRAGDQGVADFRMTRVRAAKISGHIGGAVTQSQTQVYLRNLQDEGAMARAGGATSDKNGNFSIDGVLPGDYILGALEFRGDGNDNPRHAEVPVKVDGADITNLSLSLEDSGRAGLQGTVRIEGAGMNHPGLDMLRVGLLAADDPGAKAEFVGTGGYSAVAKDGSLHLDKVSPGKYVISITADGGGWEDYYTKSVQIGGRDVTDTAFSFNATRGYVPIAISVGIDGAYVEGTVTDEENKPVANATVIGVPDQQLRGQFDLYQRGETNQNGHFRLRGIKPGGYTFFAWGSMGDESYMDPEFLRRYESAGVSLALQPKDRKSLTLKILSSDEP